MTSEVNASRMPALAIRRPKETMNHNAAARAAQRPAHRPSSGYSCIEATVPHSGQRTISIS